MDDYKELAEKLRAESDCDEYEEYTAAMLGRAADTIEELSAINERQLLEIAVLSKPRWIPVDERLPEGSYVLVCNDDGKMIIAGRAEDDWWYKYCAYDVDRWDEQENGVITHWMPLPEPPEVQA